MVCVGPSQNARRHFLATQLKFDIAIKQVKANLWSSFEQTMMGSKFKAQMLHEPYDPLMLYVQPECKKGFVMLTRSLALFLGIFEGFLP